MNNILSLIEQNNIEPADKVTLIEKFNDYEQIAKEWESKARAIVVTSVEQKTEMAMAKEARKKFSTMRIEIEKTRKALKEQSLRKGQAIDSIAKYLTSLVSPIEEYLKQQEDFAGIQAAKDRERLRIEAEEKAQVERIAKEKADAEEREKMRLENERLRREAQEHEELRLREQQEAQSKIDAERSERERLEDEIRTKQEEEEALKRNEAKERERMERDTEYKLWLKNNHFDPETMQVEKTPTGIKLWKLISVLALSH